MTVYTRLTLLNSKTAQLIVLTFWYSYKIQHFTQHTQICTNGIEYTIMRLWTQIISPLQWQVSPHGTLPLDEPNEVNAIETFAILLIQSSQAKANPLISGQPITHSHNNNKNSTLLADSQLNTILHQFPHDARGIKKFTKQVSNNIIEMTQIHNTAQEHMDKLKENTISKALAKTIGYNCITAHHNVHKH